MGESQLQETLFQLPDDPQEFGVALAPSQLRRLDFSALDFDLARRANIEYIKTYFPEDFNDFVASNGVIMLVELISYMANVLAERMDILVDESFLSTAQTKEAVSQHLQLINQEIRTATPAVVDVVASIAISVATEIRISAGLRFNLIGEDGQPLNYEIFRAPNDFTSVVSIPPGKRGVVAFGIEGRFVEPVTNVSPGGPGQMIDITQDDILSDPITVTVASGDIVTEWTQVAIIEKEDSQAEVYEIIEVDDGIRVKFGDDVTGKAPLAGQVIEVTFRVGGGTRGRIGASIINETRPITPQPPASASVEVLFRNLTPSSGGEDEETLEQAKRRAPREFATQGNAVTGEDYSLLASTFSHPVFGSVSKAVAVIRTGIDADIDEVVADIQAASSVEAGVEILQTNFVNRNIVEVYALAEGPNGPVAPSAGLKQGLITFFDDINVLTDEVRVLDGAIKPIDVEATITISRNADAGTVKEDVTDAVVSFFDIRNFDMGEGLNISNLYEEIQSVSGVKFVNIFRPEDNILPTKQLGDPTDETTVGFNELLILGNLDLKFFLELGNFSRN